MARRIRLLCEFLESRDNPSVPGGEAVYTPPAPPPPTEPVLPAPEPTIIDVGTGALAGAAAPPSDSNPLTGGSTLPYVGP